MSGPAAGHQGGGSKRPWDEQQQQQEQHATAVGQQLSLSIAAKRRHLGDVNPAREYEQPRLYQQPALPAAAAGEAGSSSPRAAGGAYGGSQQQHQGTDFSSWTEADIKAFLDERGGDFDDCPSFAALVERAVETEINTGPARKPGGTTEAAAAGYNGQPPAAAAAAAAVPAAAAADDANGDDDDEYDPLEAFMAGVEQEVAANKAKPGQAGGAAAAAAAVRCDEEADHVADYMEVRAAQQAKAAAAAAAAAGAAAAGGYGSDEEVYATAAALADDDDDQSIAAKLAARRTIDPLAPVDHASIEYEPFAKDFYTPHPAIAAMSDQEVAEYRSSLQIQVSGFDPPRPIKSFGQAGFDHLLLGAIRKAGYEAPTAIQAQALPAILSGRDVLGLAKTGSGKTAAFVLPMLVHVMDQPELGKGQGPIAIILAPTRELSEQIHRETRKFAKPYGLRCVAAFGGLSKYEQVKELKAGAEVAVATPGRMMDLVRCKACSLTRVTYLVLDEADRMFDMGFGEQVHSLLAAVRPDRQTLLFSATLPRKIEALVAEALSGPVRISVGRLGAANTDVAQRVEVLADDAAKMAWLRASLPALIDEGDVLVFVGQRSKADEVTAALTGLGFKAGAIHGDMDQFSRMHVLDAFRGGQHHVLVATDVAARGLDIKTVKAVVNYDAAREIDSHIHRVGRTGRAGDKEGLAISLLLEGKDARFAGLLVNSLSLGGQHVPPQLHDLAMKDSRFRRGNSRHKGGKHGGGGAGGRRRAIGPAGGGSGLGFGPAGAAPVPQTSAQAAAATGGVPAPAPATAGLAKLSGFARSTADYEHESSAAAGAPTRAFPFPPPPPLEPGTVLPPPPPLPPAAAAAPAAPAPAQSAAIQQQPQTQQHFAAPPAAPPAAPAPAPAPALPAQQPPQQQQQQPPAPGTMAAARAEMLEVGYTSRLKAGFVSSGVRGGDLDAAPTIVAPKVVRPAAAAAAAPAAPAGAASSGGGATIVAPLAGSRPAFRPPVPVTQRPMYLTRPTETIATRGRGRPQQPQPQQQQQVLNSTAAQQALAAAQAVAQRLAAQAAGGAPPPPAAAAPVAQSWQQQQQQPPQQQQAAYDPLQDYQQQPTGLAHAGWQQQHHPPLPSGPPPPLPPAGGAAAHLPLDAVAAAQAVAARLAAQHQGHHL